MNRRSRPSIARIRSSALLAALTATVFAAAIASAQDIRVIAITGGPTPFGAYEDVSRCAMAGDRTVVFTARTDNVDTGTTDSIFLWQNDALQRIVFENQIVQGSYQINTFLNAGQTVPAANSSGSVAFTAEFEAIGGGIDSDGVFVYDSTVGSIRPIVRDGDPAPDGNGFLGVSLGNHPAINDAHQVAVVASVFGAAGGLGNGSGVYRWTNGSLTRIARTGQANSGSFFDGFSWPSLNEAGDVAFVGFLDADDQGIYRRRGAQLTRIAFTGDESPAGWIIEDFSPVAGVAINEAGQVAFRAIVDPPFCCGRDDVIYLGDGGALTRLAFSGQAVPGGGFVPQAINRNLALNNRGQVVFAGSTSNGNSAIYRAEAGRILRIAYEDGPVPGSPSQTFTNLAGFDFAINDRGHVAFTARFDNGSDAVLGLFLYIDGTGLVRIIEEDVPFLGSFVDTVNFVGTNPSDWRAREPTGLDARGNVAFRFRLSDGRQGVAVYQNRVIFADDFESGNVDRWSL